MAIHQRRSHPARSRSESGDGNRSVRVEESVTLEGVVVYEASGVTLNSGISSTRAGVNERKPSLWGDAD